MTFALILCVATAGVLPGEAAPARSLRNGSEALETLNGGIASGGSEELYATGFKSSQLLQGLQSGDRPAVDARASETAAKAETSGGAAPASADIAAGRRPSLHVNEPPVIGGRDPRLGGGILPGTGPKEEPPKKRDWKKIVMKWLPIGIFYYASISAILNPIGAASMGIRGMAVAALIGTAMLLYREIRGK